MAPKGIVIIFGVKDQGMGDRSNKNEMSVVKKLIIFFNYILPKNSNRDSFNKLAHTFLRVHLHSLPLVLHNPSMASHKS
jgi:hypothetical protein